MLHITAIQHFLKLAERTENKRPIPLQKVSGTYKVLPGVHYRCKLQLQVPFPCWVVEESPQLIHDLRSKVLVALKELGQLDKVGANLVQHLPA